MSRLCPYEPLDAGLKRCCARSVFNELIIEGFAEWAREQLTKPYSQVALEYRRLYESPTFEARGGRPSFIVYDEVDAYPRPPDPPPVTSRRAKRRQRGRAKS